MKHEEKELFIEALSEKGNGIGYFCNEAGHRFRVEASFTLPGDRVWVSLFGKKRRTYDGRLESIIEPSQDRIAPQCAHFGSCGGCRWQHMSYDQQLAIKQSIVQNHFSSLVDASAIRSIIPCEDPWGYRNKMEFSFSNDKEGNRYLGLFMDKGRGRVFNLTECHLVSPWFAQTLEIVRHWWEKTTLEAYFPPRNSGSLRTLTLREGKATGDRMVMLTVSGNPDYAIVQRDLDTFVAALTQQIDPQSHGKLSIFLRIQQIAKGMPTNFYEMLLYGPDQIKEVLEIAPFSDIPKKDIAFGISPSAFFQPNSRQAGNLYSIALQLASIPKEGVVYDLYCGTGTLGISLAPFVKKVIGIEISPEACLDARTNAAENGFDHVEILTGSVQDKLLEMSLSKEYPLPDLVVVDPPRMGLDKSALQQLLKLQAKTIVYISCNPSTQAENVAALVAEGYAIQAIQPVDQFPHTVHIENIVVLTI